jgi:hypothetical protein
MYQAIQSIINKLSKKDVFYLTIIAIFGYILLNLKGCSGSKVETIETVHEQLYNALQDSIKVTKNAYGQLVYEKRTIETNFELFKKATSDTNRYKNELIRRLSKEVNANTQSAISFNTATTHSNSVATIVKHDTIYQSDTVYQVKKAYIVKDKNEWLNLEVYASADSSNYKLTTINKYDAFIEREKFNILKPFKSRALSAKIVNHNPYSKVTDMQSFVPIKEKKKYRGVKYAIVFGTGIFIGSKIF